MSEREKRVSEAQRRATNKYLEKFDEMRVRVPKGKKEIIQDHALAVGMSLNAYINEAIDEKIERESPNVE